MFLRTRTWRGETSLCDTTQRLLAELVTQHQDERRGAWPSLTSSTVRSRCIAGQRCSSGCPPPRTLQWLCSNKSCQTSNYTDIFWKDSLLPSIWRHLTTRIVLCDLPPSSGKIADCNISEEQQIRIPCNWCEFSFLDVNVDPWCAPTCLNRTAPRLWPRLGPDQLLGCCPGCSDSPPGDRPPSGCVFLGRWRTRKWGSKSLQI